MTNDANSPICDRIRRYMLALETGAPAKPFAELNDEWDEDEVAMAESTTARRRIQLDIGYATLTAECLATIANYARDHRIVDVGAGHGHLVRVLAANGYDTIGLEIGAEGRCVDTPGKGIIECNAVPWLAAHLGPEDVVLLSWPMRHRVADTDAGLSAAKALVPGQHLIYIGEDSDGCTGSDGFHTECSARYDVVADAPVAPILGWYGHDSLRVLTVAKDKS